MMKKTYIKPAMNVVQLSVSSMLSYSVNEYRTIKIENVGDDEVWTGVLVWAIKVELRDPAADVVGAMDVEVVEERVKNEERRR